MDYLNEIRTQFIRDRIKETEWENHSYISELYRLEGLIYNGAGGYAGAMVFGLLSKKYPVEYECIKKELKSGELTSPDEFIIRKQEWKYRKLTEEIAKKKEDGARQVEEMQEQLNRWLQAGGKL